MTRSEARANLMRAAGEFDESIAGIVRERPFESVAAAFVAGLAIARFPKQAGTLLDLASALFGQ